MPFSKQFYAKARLFHELHKQPEPLILLNAWDALSAKLFEQAGSKAIATTSAGIAAIFGYGDGQQLPKSLLLAMIERIVHSVNVPVTVDLEAGYGENNQEICETVSAILKIGAVGINIEDADPKQPGSLFSIVEQTEKIKAIRAVAKKLNAPLFINARTDIFWFKLFTPEKRLSETLIRLKAYQEAGADGIFVPGLTDAHSISEIVKDIQLPLNLLAGTWLKETAVLKSLGVTRLTIGSAAIRDVTNHLQKLAIQFVNEKDCQCFNPTVSYSNFNNLFSSSVVTTKDIPKPHVERAETKDYRENKLSDSFFSSSLTKEPKATITPEREQTTGIAIKSRL